MLLPRFLSPSSPSYCVPFLPTSVTQPNTVLSLPFPQHLSSSPTPHGVPAAPSSDTVYLCVSRDNVPSLNTFTDGDASRPPPLNAAVKRTVGRGEVLNLASHSPSKGGRGVVISLDGRGGLSFIYQPAHLSRLQKEQSPR